MSLLQNSNAISDSGYNIANSLRFQSASSQYLNRTPASVTNQKTWTWSGWVKRGTLSSIQCMFGGGTTAANSVYLYWSSGDNLQFGSNGGQINLQSTAVYRDPSAWYHIVATFDTTQATAANRMRLYVNGVQLTAFNAATYPSQNVDYEVNSSVAHNFGRTPLGQYYFDGYMTEVNFVDGQALTPSSFGETNTLTGQWVAKKYTGTYGTNGFYLPFSNGTSTTTLGYDSSGNSNNWTLNNFTRSAGVSDCWMTDVPSGNGSAVGGTQPNSNYCVLNPLDMPTISGMTITNANLNSASSSTDNRFHCRSTTGMTSGKFYWEVTAISGNRCQAGIALATSNKNEYVGYDASGWGIFQLDGAKFYNQAGTSGTPYGSAWSTAGDILMTAFDADSGKLWWGKNGTWFASGDPVAGTNAAFTGLASNTYFPAIGDGSGAGVYSAAINFGQRSFAYTPPSGFKALCTANLPTSTIVKGNQYMDATTYTGTGATVSITNAGGFSPDFLWIKQRSTGTTQNHTLWDTNRGVAGGFLMSNSTDATGYDGGGVTSFNSNGWTMGGSAGLNESGKTFVAWQWDAGSSTVTNTSGSISSQVRANPTAGVSVVTYTGNGSAGATVGHGLGVAPAMFVTKRRSTSGSNWTVYHRSLGGTRALYLNTTEAQQTFSDIWNNTNPNATTFTLGTTDNTNLNGGTYVAYCFSEIAGFSKFGSYTGNGSTDGTFTFTGFTPRWVLIKQSSTSGNNWQLIDTARETTNPNDTVLFPNTSGAEGTLNATIDVLSNGFKIRTTDGSVNTNGATYIYACFASNPFQNSNAF